MSSHKIRHIIIFSIILVLILLVIFGVLYINNIIIIGRIEKKTEAYIVVSTFLKSADKTVYPYEYLKYKIYSTKFNELTLDDNDLIIAVVSSSQEQSLPPGVTGYFVAKLPIE